MKSHPAHRERTLTHVSFFLSPSSCRRSQAVDLQAWIAAIIADFRWSATVQAPET